MHTSRRITSVVVGIVLITISVVWYVSAQQDVTRVQYSTAGPTSATGTMSASPTPSKTKATPSPSASGEKTSASSDPSDSDVPVKVTVKRGSKVIVKPVTIGSVTSFSAKDVWSPVPGTAEWYRLDDYPRPGVASTLKSVIGGHVTYGRKSNGDPKPNVFYTLSDAIKGDSVIVTYKSGKTYTFTVTKIVIEDKEVIRTDQEIWGYGEKSRSVVLFTCDTQCGYSANMHTKCNRAVIATMK